MILLKQSLNVVMPRQECVLIYKTQLQYLNQKQCKCFSNGREKRGNRQEMVEKKESIFEKKNSKRAKAGQNKLRLTLTKELETIMAEVGMAMPPFSVGNASHARHT